MVDLELIGQVVRFIVRAGGPVLRGVYVHVNWSCRDMCGQKNLIEQNSCTPLPPFSPAVWTVPCMAVGEMQEWICTFEMT